MAGVYRHPWRRRPRTRWAGTKSTGTAQALAGTSAGTSTSTGDLVVAHDLAGTSAGTSTTTGALTVAHTLAGTSAGTSSTTGDVAVAHSLAGTSAGTSTSSGNLAVAHPLAGTSAGTSTSTGNLTVAHPLAGTSAGTSTSTGTLSTTGHVLAFDNDAAHYARFDWSDIDLTGPLSFCFVTHRTDPGDEFDHWMLSLYDEDAVGNYIWFEHSGGPIGGGEFQGVITGPDGGNADLHDAAISPATISDFGKSWEIWLTWDGQYDFSVSNNEAWFHWRNLTDAPSTWHHAITTGPFARALLSIISNGSLYVGGTPNSGPAYSGSIGFIGGWNADLYNGGAGHLGTDPIHTKTSDLQAIDPSSMRFGADLTSTTPASIIDLAGQGVVCTAITATLTGAIPEWNFDGTAPTGATKALAGTSAGTSTSAGALTVAHPLAGTSAGTSTTSGALTVAHSLAGASAGTSTTTGALNVAHSLAGTSSGTSTTTGDLSLSGQSALAGTSAGTSTSTGALTVAHTLVGTSAGASTTTGDLAVTHPLAGTSAGTSTTTGALAPIRGLAGTSAGTSTTTGAVSITRGLAGTSAGTSTTTGAVLATWALAGTSPGASTSTGALAVFHLLAGQSAGASVTVGALTVVGDATLLRWHPGHGRALPATTGHATTTRAGTASRPLVGRAT